MKPQHEDPQPLCTVFEGGGRVHRRVLLLQDDVIVQADPDLGSDPRHHVFCFLPEDRQPEKKNYMDNDNEVTEMAEEKKNYTDNDNEVTELFALTSLPWRPTSAMWYENEGAER